MIPYLCVMTHNIPLGMEFGITWDNFPMLNPHRQLCKIWTPPFAHLLCFEPARASLFSTPMSSCKKCNLTFTQNKKLVKVSRAWSLGQVGQKWSSDQLRIICAISHLSNLFMVSVNYSHDLLRPFFLV